MGAPGWRNTGMTQCPVFAENLGNSGHASILGGHGSPASEYPTMNGKRELSTGFNTICILQESKFEALRAILLGESAWTESTSRRANLSTE